MTKNSNAEPIGQRGVDVARGRRHTRRAGTHGFTLRDQTTESHPTIDVEVIGGTVVDLDEGDAQLIVGGGTGSPGNPGGGSGPGGSGDGGDAPGTAGTPILMRNNSGAGLPTGSCVVVDDALNRSVTTTTTPGDTRIAGFTLEPIAEDAIGPVLFNGYAPGCQVLGTPTRGQYLRTSATEGYAEATDDRVAGSFAVVVSALDIPTFASDSAVTSQEEPVTSLAIDMPTTVTDTTALGRMLFLALYRDPGETSDPTIAGWDRVGATSGFWYYTRLCVGGDTATASWDDPSPAVAIVLVLHESVHVADAIEDFDYEATSAAAEITGLSSNPRYAIAGVDALEDAPSGWTLLGRGVAGFDPGSGLTILQEKEGDKAGTTFDAPVTVGSLLIAVCHVRASAADPDLRMASDAFGTLDTSWSDVAVNQETGAGAANLYDRVSLQAKIATSTSAGPFYNTLAPTGDMARIYLFEVAGVGIAGVTALSGEGDNSSPVDIGTFASVGANDLVVFAAITQNNAGSTSDPVITASGYTEDEDAARIGFGHPWIWIGHRSGSGAAVDAELTYTTGSDYYFAAVAAHFVSQEQGAAGTVVGTYIGSDSSVTSPWSGSGQEGDALFAINLDAFADVSAILYGPDLGAADTGSEAVVDHGNMGATETVDVADGTWHRGTLDENCTITVQGFTVDEGTVVVFEVTDSGGNAVTWDPDVSFIGSDQPTADAVTVFLLFSSAGDSTIYGVRVGGGSLDADGVRDAGRWELAVVPGDPPDPLYADGDFLYIWVPGA